MGMSLYREPKPTLDSQTISKLQGQLTTLITSLDRIKQGNQLYLLLVAIARETNLMLKSKKVQWWMS